MAARWNMLSFEQFLGMEGEEQARMVAAYETALQIDGVTSRDNQKRSAAKKRGRR